MSPGFAGVYEHPANGLVCFKAFTVNFSIVCHNRFFIPRNFKSKLKAGGRFRQTG